MVPRAVQGERGFDLKRAMWVIAMLGLVCLAGTAALLSGAGGERRVSDEANIRPAALQKSDAPGEVRVVDELRSGAQITGFISPRVVESTLRGLPRNSVRAVALEEPSSEADLKQPERAASARLLVDVNAASRDPVDQTRATWHALLVGSALAIDAAGAGREPPSAFVTVLTYPDGKAETPATAWPTWSLSSAPAPSGLAMNEVGALLNEKAAALGLTIAVISLHPRTGMPAPEIVLVAPSAFFEDRRANQAMGELMDAAAKYGPYLIDVRDEAGETKIITTYSAILQMGAGYQAPGVEVLARRGAISATAKGRP